MERNSQQFEQHERHVEPAGQHGEPTECLTPDCHSTEIASRGVCQRCYQTYARIVRTKQRTWEQLEAAKLVLPSNPGPPISPARAAALGIESQQQQVQQSQQHV
jgi:uncharacterized paraquat-inducible protein A